MDSKKPKFDATKMMTLWWDLVDHYVLAVMFAVSLASVGIQTTQDCLTCIPAVNCSDLARDDPVVRKWSELSNMLHICNRSPSYVVLTKMSDLRQYDYVDNECYEKMLWFSRSQSIIFLAEAVILLAISNFWQKCPASANALAYCDQMLSESMMKEVLVQEETDKEHAKLRVKLGLFIEGYSDEVTIFSPSSVTGQYRLRGLVGLIFTILFLALNGIYYSLSSGWTQCHLDGHIAFSSEHRFFQCIRSMETYFRTVSAILLFVFLPLHLVFVICSFVWSLTGKRRGPEFSFSQVYTGPGIIHGDAAFMCHLLQYSNYGILRKKMQED
ncbi:volume-regulated anion channel subunit LRRC8A-like [Acropora muricata]|uniref:volume-regulated anion channel subunit LRRC8A-like n=1 Tax=Acropora muricata TaxID=159855 RepID=UPI0034E37B7B